MPDIRKLELHWYVPGFLPISPKSDNFELLSSIAELLNPDDFMNPEFIKDYWSFPEILMEMRWVLQRAGKIAPEPNDPNFHKNVRMDEIYYEMLAYLKHIVTTLGMKAAQYQQSVIVLEQEYKEKQVFIDYWETWKHKLHQNPDKILKCELTAFIELPDLEENSLYQKARDNAKKLEDSAYAYLFQEISKEEYSVQGQEFIQALRQFFAEYLQTPHISAAKRKLYALGKWVKEALMAYEQPSVIPKADKWDTEYRTVLWHELQKVANCTCKSFRTAYHTVKPEQQLSMIQYGDLILNNAENLRQIIADVLVKLNIKEKRWYLDKLVSLTAESDRCVALLEYLVDDKEYYSIAFSGYFDIPDTASKVFSCLLPNGDIRLLPTFRDIVCEIKSTSDSVCTLCELTDDLAEHIYFINPDDISKVSLMDKLRSNWTNDGGRYTIQDKEIIKKIKSTFSCCERKLLGSLDQNGHVPGSMKFYIKKMPCKNCRSVINDWWNNHPNVAEICVDYIRSETDTTPPWQPLYIAFNA